MTASEPRLVKPPQSRRGRGHSYVTVAESGGRSVYEKHQRDYWCRPIWRLFRRTPLLRRELRALRAFHALDINVPEVIDYREQGASSCLALVGVAESLPLDEALREPAADRVAIVSAVADVVGRAHRAGWSHGALYPHHILISRTLPPTVTLIDLEKARRNPFKRRRDLQRFWRHAPPLAQSEREHFEALYRRTSRGR